MVGCRAKPSCPTPDGRICLDGIADMRLVMAPVCLVLSLRYGTQALLASAVCAALTIRYGELHGDKLGLSKSILVVAGKSIQLQTIYHFTHQGGGSPRWQAGAACNIPKAARFATMLGIPLWSFGLSSVWKMDRSLPLHLWGWMPLAESRDLGVIAQGAQDQSMACLESAAQSMGAPGAGAGERTRANPPRQQGIRGT
ncbi:hypothetical protein BDR05DRAFT_994346 [Suillus weaverae]|nr:hypothetical protein BDR05DRAFT_994346 [Suillus weaverae]